MARTRSKTRWAEILDEGRADERLVRTARHAARGAASDSAALEPDPDEPGHAAHRGAAPPPQLGRRAGEPRLRSGGRGARLPRRVRVARGERAAPPAPARGCLRDRAAVHVD